MKNQIKEIKNKELVVRKKITGFLKKLLRFCGYDFGHIRYKQIIYSEIAYESTGEEEIKRYYDGLIYLLNNKKSLVTSRFLDTFFAVALTEKINRNVSAKIANETFKVRHLEPLEQIIRLHLCVYEELEEIEEKKRLIISLIYLNYLLVANEIPGIEMLRVDLKIYLLCKKEYYDQDKGKLRQFIIEVLKKNQYQEKEYYKNLTYLDKKMVIEKIKEKEEILKQNYYVKSITLYGSFVRGEERDDSDVDILIEHNADITYEEREDNLNKVQQYLTNELNRYVDVHEIINDMTDGMIKSAVNARRIF